jgi:hypothetical protein
MKYALAALLLLPALAHSAMLVRSAPAPSATPPANWSYQPPSAGIVAVQVLRGGTTPFVLLADVLPTERISACDDGVKLAGQQGNCSKPLNGRSDNWALKGELFPTGPVTPPAGTEGRARLRIVDQTHTTFTDGTPIPTGTPIWLMIVDYDTGERIAVTPHVTPWEVEHRWPLAQVKCFASRVWIDINRDAVETINETSLGNSVCSAPFPDNDPVPRTPTDVTVTRQ